MTAAIKHVASISEAAEISGKSESWLRKLCQQGRLGRRSGKVWLIDVRELEKLDELKVGRPAGRKRKAKHADRNKPSE